MYQLQVCEGGNYYRIEARAETIEALRANYEKLLAERHKNPDEREIFRRYYQIVRVLP